jgi:hypothetical protein
MTRPYVTYRRPTFRQRILTLFATRQGRPMHYTRIAEQLGQCTTRQVYQACWVLWCQGRLQWYKEGVYQLPPGRGKEERHG